jgi:hypothetical protein
MEKIAKRSYRYLRRTIKNVVHYKEAIAGLAHQLSQKGYRAVVLVGESDLDFIVEHVCARDSLRCIRVDSVKEAQDSCANDSSSFLLFSESFSGVEPQENQAHCAYLHKLLSKMHSSKGF